MNSYILTGSQEEKDGFVKNFIKDKKIASYNINAYTIHNTARSSTLKNARAGFLFCEYKNIDL